MARYIIEKDFCDNYIHGVLTLTENNVIKSFATKELATNFLLSLGISHEEINRYYNIKQSTI